MSVPEKGQKVILCPFDVGCRGFIGYSIVQFLSKIGVSAKDRKKTQLKASETVCRGIGSVLHMGKASVHPCKMNDLPICHGDTVLKKEYSDW